MDFAADIGEAVQELTAVLAWIESEITAVGEKLSRHTSNLTQLAARGSAAKPSEANKIALLAAHDMNNFSKSLESVLPNFEDSIRRLDTGFSGYVSLADPESFDDTEQVKIASASLSEMLELARQAQGAIGELRDSTLALGRRRISQDLTKAANRQAKALEGVVRNIEEVQSFALRVNFQITEKFGELPGTGAGPP